VPVRDPATVLVGEDVDLAAAGAAVGRASVVDPDLRVAAIALDAEARRRALDELVAPSFTLPDLEGVPRSLDEWRGLKKLLVAFASW
jgi:hypothetical protein